MRYKNSLQFGESAVTEADYFQQDQSLHCSFFFTALAVKQERNEKASHQRAMASSIV